MTLPGFEGPEKLLEIWFTPRLADGSASPIRRTASISASDNSSAVAAAAFARITPNGTTRSVAEDDADMVLRERPGLLGVARSTWTAMLAIVQCEVLSVVRGFDVDAYLLSESSMFVFQHKLILKTCGTTTLLLCLDRLLEIARTEAGLSGHVDYVFFSRKSFMFPDHQPFPHNNFSAEVDHLNAHFHQGSAYVVGKVNGDHWYCFLWEEKQKVLYLNETDQEEAAYIEEQRMVEGPNDQTLEILMCALEPVNAAKMFHKSSGISPQTGRAYLTEVVQQLYPEALIDEFMFEPCGYSCNGITPFGYFTIHVTPEPHCSYASFETNIPTGMGLKNYPNAYAEVIARIVGFFQPSRFTVTLFTEKDLGPQMAPLDAADGKTLTIGNAVRGFDRQDKVLYEFENYDLMFFHYARAKHLIKDAARPVAAILDDSLLMSGER